MLKHLEARPPEVIEDTDLTPIGSQLVSALFNREMTEAPDQEIVDWNQGVVEELLELQLKENELCFFVALCVLSRTLYPNRRLPSVSELIQKVEVEYSEYLQENKLFVEHEKIAEALANILPTWGMGLTGYGLNRRGDIFIGEGMREFFGEPQFTQFDNEPLPTPNPDTNAVAAYAMMLHQFGNDTHVMANDGRPETLSTLKEYQDAVNRFRAVAIFEIARL